MIETSTKNVKEFLFEQKLIFPALILMAHSGERDILERVLGSEEAAYSVVSNAKKYGDMTKNYGNYDYPISISLDGQLIKQPYRIAGLIMSGQKKFFSIKCGLPPEPQPDFKLTKKEKERLDAFFLSLIYSPPNTLDASSVDSSVAMSDLSAAKKS